MRMMFLFEPYDIAKPIMVKYLLIKLHMVIFYCGLRSGVAFYKHPGLLYSRQLKKNRAGLVWFLGIIFKENRVLYIYIDIVI